MDKETELRILNNFIGCMPKVYRTRNTNWQIVRDILLQGTSTAGSTSCMKKCNALDIDPYGYDLDEIKDEFENETSQEKQKRLNCYVGNGCSNWSCYEDCAFWDGKECTKDKDI